jgi:4-amino-4-deoxy-L-arabinose transferase-like glycosyltransferase
MDSERLRDLILVAVLALVTRLAVAALLTRPGYMDTAYYAAGAVRLAEGGGLSDAFLWHYLDDPSGLPHPGFLYWMPLPSLLAAPFAVLFPGSFFALQIPFAVLSALLPLVAYRLAWRVGGRRFYAWLAALFMLFSGFFFPYWTLPETFAPFALVGSLALWLAGDQVPGVGQQRSNGGRWVLTGLLAGLAHLTRADGVLFLPVVALAALVSSPWRTTRRGARSILYRLSSVVVGYLLVMAPWFLRNLFAIGTPLSPAGTKTLWLRTYDELFCYRCDLSLRSYLAWGWTDILRSKLWAAGVNLERFLAEDCLVFLLPFVLIGLYRLRRRSTFLLASVYMVLIYLAHSLAFTFPGPRGGFFHASAPALPFLFTAGVEGLEAAVGWAARRRRWNLRQAQAVFGAAAAVLAVFLSIFVAAQKVPVWRHTDAVYGEIGRWLAEERAKGGTVMVANPPAFWYHVKYPAVVVPNDDVEALLAIADRYNVRYVVLDRNRPPPLAEMYAMETLHPRLRPVVEWKAEGDRFVMYEVE